MWTDGCPGGEAAADVGARADRVIARARDIDGDVALFAHGHLLRVLGARWVGLAPEDGSLLVLSTAGLSVLGYERETAVVLKWNT
jgi:probable phosphoglycerate mutase